MSIQQYIASQRSGKLFLLRASNQIHTLKQKFWRYICHGKPNVFFPYHSLINTHPFFIRYYQHPPLGYCNARNAELAHWINSPENILGNLNHVIEPNDHPLSVLRLTEPRDVIRNVDKAIEIYMRDSCKKILVESEGQLKLFKRYLPESVIEKTEIIGLGAVPKIILPEVKNKPLSKITFLCLASDYQRKAVDIVISSWINSEAKNNSVLILACPNVPQSIENILKQNNVVLIKKAPLTTEEKAILHKKSHVSVAPLHIDGGTNILEAFEFGLPVITMRSQRSFVNKKNGWEVDVPFYFYDEGYGNEWRTWGEFWETLSASKKGGLFDQTINDLTLLFNQIIRNPEVISNMGCAAYEDASNGLSLNLRNSRLLRIYQDCL